MAPYRPKSLDELNSIYDKAKSAEQAIEKGKSLLRDEKTDHTAEFGNRSMMPTAREPKSEDVERNSAEISGAVDSFKRQFSSDEKRTASAYSINSEQHESRREVYREEIRRESDSAFESLFAFPEISKNAEPQTPAEPQQRHQNYMSADAPVREGELSELMDDYIKVMTDDYGEDDEENARSSFLRRRKNKRRTAREKLREEQAETKNQPEAIPEFEGPETSQRSIPEDSIFSQFEELYSSAEKNTEPEQEYKPAEEYTEPEQEYEPAEEYIEPEQEYEPAEEYIEPEQEYEPAEEYVEPEAKNGKSADSFDEYEPMPVFNPEKLFSDPDSFFEKPEETEPEINDVPQDEAEANIAGDPSLNPYTGIGDYPSAFEDITSRSDSYSYDDDEEPEDDDDDLRDFDMGRIIITREINRKPKGKTAAKVLLSILLAFVILATVMVGAINSVLGINTGKTSVGGYYLFAVTYSYEQTGINRGDLVICEKKSAVEDNDKIVYIDVDSKSFSFGVKNGEADDPNSEGEMLYFISGAPVKEANILGVVSKTVPKAGTAVRFIIKNFIILIASLAALAVIICLVLGLAFRTRNPKQSGKTNNRNNNKKSGGGKKSNKKPARNQPKREPAMAGARADAYKVDPKDLFDDIG